VVAIRVDDTRVIESFVSWFLTETLAMYIGSVLRGESELQSYVSVQRRFVGIKP